MRWPERTNHREVYYLPFEEAETPRSGEVIVDHWWIVHPEHGVAHLGTGERYCTPLCNMHEVIVRRIAKNSYPDHEVRQLPLVFLGHRQEAYL